MWPRSRADTSGRTVEGFLTGRGRAWQKALSLCASVATSFAAIAWNPIDEEFIKRADDAGGTRLRSYLTKWNSHSSSTRRFLQRLLSS